MTSNRFDPHSLAATVPRKNGGKSPAAKPVSPSAAESTVATADQQQASTAFATTDDQEANDTAPPPPDTALTTPPATAIIEMPIHTCHPGFATPRIDCRLTPRQAAAAKFLWCSLADKGERFDGGRTSHPEGKAIENANEGLRWILDYLADAIEADTGKDLITEFNLKFR